MITHRMATQSAPEPPTKLYKVLAISFLVLTALVLVGVLFITSKTATIVIQAKEDAKKIDVSVAVADANSDTAVKGAASTTSFAWSEKYTVNGTKKVDGVSEGKVTLHNTSNTAQPLVKTTRLLNQDGVLFRLTDGVTVPAGGTVEARVYADKAGAAGDIGPSKFTIPGLPAARQAEVYAESSAEMSGGEATLGVLTAEDIDKAKEDFKQKVQDAFSKSLPALDQNQGRVVDVAVPSFAINHAPGDEVPSFTVSGTSTVQVVTYDASALADVIDKQVTTRVNTAAERYLADGAAPTVGFGSVSKDGTASLSVKQSITVTLDANVEKLAPKNFTGKKKEEIQLDRLGLDHVAAVDVKFSPFWVLVAPSNPDKIKVVVKNM